MKQRIRFPDGQNRDIDHGPGPVGYQRGYGRRTVGAVSLADATRPRISGWTAVYEQNIERKRAKHP